MSPFSAMIWDANRVLPGVRVQPEPVAAKLVADAAEASEVWTADELEAACMQYRKTAEAAKVKP